jgi:hypothetical protein
MFACNVRYGSARDGGRDRRNGVETDQPLRSPLKEWRPRNKVTMLALYRRANPFSNGLRVVCLFADFHVSGVSWVPNVLDTLIAAFLESFCPKHLR